MIDRADGQRDRRRQPVVDQAAAPTLAVVAVAEVEVQEDALHVVARTGCRRLVQPELVADVGDRSAGSALRPARSCAGSAAGKHVEER